MAVYSEALGRLFGLLARITGDHESLCELYDTLTCMLLGTPSMCSTVLTESLLAI